MEGTNAPAQQSAVFSLAIRCGVPKRIESYES